MKFEAKYAKNRNKYIDFLEVNNYFGVDRCMPENILFALPESEDFYFLSDDVDYLNFKSIDFISLEIKINRC